MSSIQFVANTNERATVHVKGLSTDVDEDLLFELGVQFGQVVRVTIPVNRITLTRQDWGFIEFASPADAKYMRDVTRSSVAPIRLFGRDLIVSFRNENMLNRDKDNAGGGGADMLLDIGARIVISGLDSAALANTDMLREHFSQFGKLAVRPRIEYETQQQQNSAASAGGGGGGGGPRSLQAFVSFTSFESADAAIKGTNNQFLFGKSVTVQYALREDGKGRHGSAEERALYSAHQELKQTQQQVKNADAAPGFMPQHTPAPPPPPPPPQQQQKPGTNQNVPEWAKGVNPYG